MHRVIMGAWFGQIGDSRDEAAVDKISAQGFIGSSYTQISCNID